MADEVEISVIVPVYKGIRFLREALASLRAQTFTAWECVCVDDGSKDGSGALADEIAAEEPRIRVLHVPNGGTSVARNRGLEVCRGRYVAYLDEDDAYDPRMLETLYRAIEKYGADVVGCEFREFAETAHPVFDSPVPSEDRWTVADREGIRELASKNYRGVPYEIWRNLFRRELIAGHPFPAGVRVEQDQLWLYTLLPRITKYVRIPWYGYHWRASSIGGYLHPDFASMMSRLKTTATVLGVMDGAMGLSPEQRENFRQAISEDLGWNVHWNLRTGFRMTAAESRQLRAALRGLAAEGVDVRRTLHAKKRLLWNLFMLTGWTRWVRR